MSVVASILYTTKDGEFNLKVIYADGITELEERFQSWQINDSDISEIFEVQICFPNSGGNIEQVSLRQIYCLE